MAINTLHNEQELLSKIAGGDHVAFRILFGHYRNKVFTYAHQFLKSREQAEEVVQDVFLKMWIHRNRLADVHNSFSAGLPFKKDDVSRPLRRGCAFWPTTPGYFDIIIIQLHHKENDHIPLFSSLRLLEPTPSARK